MCVESMNICKFKQRYYGNGCLAIMEIAENSILDFLWLSLLITVYAYTYLCAVLKCIKWPEQIF